jgi:hypothetical protein
MTEFKQAIAAVVMATAIVSCGFSPVGAAPAGFPNAAVAPLTIDVQGGRGYGCGFGPAGPIPPGGYWNNGQFYPCERERGERREYRRDYRDRSSCGIGPAGPIPPGGYWHNGRFYSC